MPNPSQEETDINSQNLFVDSDLSYLGDEDHDNDEQEQESRQLDNIDNRLFQGENGGTEISASSTNQTPSNIDSDSIELLDERDISNNDNDNEHFNLNDAFNNPSPGTPPAEYSSTNDIDFHDPNTHIHSNNNSNSNDPNEIVIIPTQDPSIMSYRSTSYSTPTIDLDKEEQLQQVVEILDDEDDERELTKSQKPPETYKPIKEYLCPICFEPPDIAMVTTCGHVFCCDCLFQMVNNSNPSRNPNNTSNAMSGLCALCRSKVDLRHVVMMKLRKKNTTIDKSNQDNLQP